VLSLGGRFTFNDDGQTPNSQLALFQYDPGPLVIFELRNLPSEQGPKTINERIRCQRGDAALPNPTGESGDTGGFKAHKGHLFNFLSAVRGLNPIFLDMYSQQESEQVNKITNAVSIRSGNRFGLR